MHTVTYRQFSTLVEVLEERKKNLLLAGLPAHFSAMQMDDQRVREDARGMLARTPAPQRTAASCLVGYSSPRCPRRRSRSRPMNHPSTNAANRKVCINASVRSAERIASSVHASATSCREEMDGLRCCLEPKTGLGHVFDCVLWIRRHQSSVGRGDAFFRGFVPAAKAPIRRARLILPS